MGKVIQKKIQGMSLWARSVDNDHYLACQCFYVSGLVQACCNSGCSDYQQCLDECLRSDGYILASINVNSSAFTVNAGTKMGCFW